MIRVNPLLRLEGGVVLVAAVLAYSAQGYSTLWFILLLLAPDIFMLGYLVSRPIGHKLYNLGHSYTLPAIIASLGLINHVDILLQASLIWVAHIGFDRLLGYGLKIGPAFQDTHLGVIGRNIAKKKQTRSPRSSRAA